MLEKLNTMTLLLAVALSCCGGCSENRSADEQQRPLDWTSHVVLMVSMAPEVDGMNRLVVDEHEVSAPFSDLSEQLFDMAFSGDATVYKPDIFGEPDMGMSLNPKELVDELAFFDTVYVEDVHTGTMRDTVIDLSFTKSSVTSMMFEIYMERGETSEARLGMVGMGKQIFNPEDGSRRGVSQKFYISGGETSKAPRVKDRLMVFTDSLGEFAPYAFMVHREISEEGLSGWLKRTYPENNRFIISFDLGMNSAAGRVFIQNFTVEAIGNEDPV